MVRFLSFVLALFAFVTGVVGAQGPHPMEGLRIFTYVSGERVDQPFDVLQARLATGEPAVTAVYDDKGCGTFVWLDTGEPVGTFIRTRTFWGYGDAGLAAITWFVETERGLVALTFTRDNDWHGVEGLLLR